MSTRWFSLLLVCSLACVARGQEIEIEKSDLHDGLAEGYKYFQDWQTGAEGDAEKAKLGAVKFRETLQRLAPQLQFVPADVGVAKKYHKVTLNAGKKPLDAIVFKTPKGDKNFDLDWEFVTNPGAFRSWYILPREGTMSGFKVFNRQVNHEEAGVDLPKENIRVIQPLHEGVLKPNQEYIIWFSFAEEMKPTEFFIRLALNETKPAAPPADPAPAPAPAP